MAKKKAKRNYRKEYDTYQGTPEQRKNNNLRRAARRKLEKAGKVKPFDGREVDHKKPLSKGGTNHGNNLRVVARSTNRKKGAKK